MIEDLRTYERYPLSIDIRVYLPDSSEIILESMDISDGGVFLRVRDEIVLEIGSEVKVQIADSAPDAEPRPVIPARIVRRTELGVGLQYLLEN